MNAKPLNLAQIREILRAEAPAVTVRKAEGGEIRITFTQAAIAETFPGLSRAEMIEKAESLAAYESDAESALETGRAMARVGLAPRKALDSVYAAYGTTRAELAAEIETGETGPDWEPTPATRCYAQRGKRFAFGPTEAAAREALEALETEAAPAKPEAAPAKPEAIRLEMNWSGAAGIIAAALENGTGEGKRAARLELSRMAELADERNRLARELAERESAELSATAEALEREESAAPVNLDKARQLGALACDCDLPRSANPFPAGDAAEAWDSGYSEAVAQWRAAKRAEIADSYGDAAADEF